MQNNKVKRKIKDLMTETCPICHRTDHPFLKCPDYIDMEKGL